MAEGATAGGEKKGWWAKQPPVLKVIVGFLVVILLIVAVGGGYFVLSRRHGVVKTRPAAEPVAAAIPVHMTFAQPKVFQQVIVVDGQTAAGPVVNVTATTAGTLVGLPEAGDVVLKGQPVALLKASPLGARSALQEDEQRSKAEYITPPITNGSRWVGSSVPRVERPVGVVTLTAPVTGQVLPLLSMPNTLMSAGQPVVRLNTLAPLTMTGLVDTPTAQRLLALLKSTPGGWPFKATLADGRVVSATLTDVGVVSHALPGSASAATGSPTYQVVARLDVPQRAMRHHPQLIPDLAGRMVIPAEKIAAYQLPHRWLVRRSDGTLNVMGVTSANTMVFLPVQPLADSAGGLWATGLPGAPAVRTDGSPLVDASGTVPDLGVNGMWLITGWPVRLAQGQKLAPRVAGKNDLLLESDAPISGTLATPQFAPALKLASDTVPVVTSNDFVVSPIVTPTTPVSGLLPPPFAGVPPIKGAVQ